MASERFCNLPEEKKQRIIAAARDELSRVPYDEVSINRIVKEAGIARGSFYEYFADKDDMIEYLMGDYCRRMERMFGAMFQAGRLDIFDAARRAVACTVEFSREEGREALCRNLFSCMRMNRRFSFERMMDTERTLVTTGLPYIDRERFRDASDEAVSFLLDTLVVLARNTIARIFTDPENREQYLAQLDRRLVIIKHGALLPEDQ